MGTKLFGNSASPRLLSETEADGKKKPVKKKKRTALDRWVSTLLILVTLESCYCIGAFSNIPIIAKARTIWIETAMSTMTHHWLATAFFPPAVVDAVTEQMDAARNAQIGVSSDWNIAKMEKPEHQTESSASEPEQEEVPDDRRDFFEVFYELDEASMDAYVQDNPEVIADGWDHIKINEAGLDDGGTEIYTTAGDQVLAIDAENEALVLRVEGSGVLGSYRGVLALAKDPSRLSLQVSPTLGSVGTCAGDIAEDHNGILAMTGSGFIDPSGTGNGGILAGYAMCDGVEYGDAHMGWSYKRIELHKDDRFYIVDAQDSVGADTTDAVEFMPALIVDGTTIVDEDCGWNSINPRAVVGQNDHYNIMMLVIEGRQLDSVGCGVVECADILSRYGCMQAMNLDGGSSAILWYDGEYITRCGNRSLSEGRSLPNAFVYSAKN